MSWIKLSWIECWIELHGKISTKRKRNRILNGNAIATILLEQNNLTRPIVSAQIIYLFTAWVHAIHADTRIEKSREGEIEKISTYSEESFHLLKYFFKINVFHKLLEHMCSLSGESMYCLKPAELFEMPELSFTDILQVIFSWDTCQWVMFILIIITFLFQ